MEVNFTENGYMHISADMAQTYFPQDVLVAIPKGRELWLFPIRGAAAGGLLLKQRNLKGDRSVVIWELLPPNMPPGPRPAFWDDRQKVLRVALEVTT